jgi:acyl-CoA thioesterase FadM
VTLQQIIYASGERAADVKSVIVYCDYLTGKPRELTAEIRTTLAPYVDAGGSD